MGCTKAFATLDEQINILKSRKLKIDDEDNAKYILSRENYYNVINGYKEPFLKKDLSGKKIVPEEYIDNCTFDELYALCCFDRELRNLLVGFLLKFEAHIKSACAYRFSEKFQNDYSYLSAENYSKEKSDLTAVLSNIATLSNEIKKSRSAYIIHYKGKYDCVPLWVLVNSLTIGNMSYFYNAIDNSLKETIAKEFSLQYKKDYNSKQKIASEEMKDVLKTVNLFRNACAHDEVLFLFKLEKSIKAANFAVFFTGTVLDESTFAEGNLYTLICLLKLVLPKVEFDDFIDRLKILFDKYKTKFSAVKFDDIISLSGFKKDWDTELIK